MAGAGSDRGSAGGGADRSAGACCAGRRRPQPAVVVERLHDAADDPHVVGLIAKVGGGGCRWPRPRSSRSAVRAFRAAGKPRVGMGRDVRRGRPGHAGATCSPPPSTRSGCSRPATSACTGVAVEPLFLRGALDSSGIEPQFEPALRVQERRRPLRCAATSARRTGRRASGSRSPRSTRPSTDVAAGRGLAPRRRPRRSSTARRCPAAEARDAGLVDRLGYRRRGLRRGTRGRRARTCRCCSSPPIARQPRPDRDVRAAPGAPERASSRSSTPSARSGSAGAGADCAGAGAGLGHASGRPAGRRRPTSTSAPSLLRVDSPGGSYVASDTIWRAVRRVAGGRQAGRRLHGRRRRLRRLLHRLPRPT